MSWDNVWEDVHKSKDWGSYPCEDLIRFIARNFYSKNRKEIKILEVGFGSGANIWYLSREKFDVYGVEGSFSATKKCEDRLKNEGLNANLIVGDIIKLPFSDNYFDAVIDVACLYCNSRVNTKLILNEIKRILKYDGLFYSLSMAKGSYLGETYKTISSCEYTDVSDGPFKDLGLVRLESREDIKILYEEFFSVISIDRYDYTRDNENMKISQWSIVSKKDK